ncbi:hypothetical protein [Neptuniibacter sp. QD37_11]|uniref:hypothetical protein n=1 Tax=Neptuniibacter sp. QD37_11 TaxID=3398209 RepID=UPI0039F44859
MKLFIPIVGSQLRLLKPATVSVKYASQNNKFIKSYEEMNNLAVMKSRKTDINLPKGLELTVDRVYIRQGDSADYNSLTFKTQGDEMAGIPKGRFFLSVDMVNTLDVKVVESKPDLDLPLHKVISKKWDSYSHNARVSSYKILKDIMGDTPVLGSGKISINLVTELERHQAALDECLESAGFQTIVEAKERIIETHGEGSFENICEELAFARKSLIDRTEIPAFTFDQYAVNGEIVLSLQNTFHKDHFAFGEILDQMYHIIRCVKYALTGDRYTHVGVKSSIDLVSSTGKTPFTTAGARYGISQEYGAHIYRNPEDEAEALLLGSSFSKSVLLHTKEYKNHPFAYEFEGEAIEVPALRREFNKRLKTAEAD